MIVVYKIEWRMVCLSGYQCENTSPINSCLSVCDMSGSFQTTVGVHRKGFFPTLNSLPVSVQEFDS